MGDAEVFKESNQRLATSFATRLDTLSDSFFQLAEASKMEIDRTYRIGAWDRIKRLDRLVDGEEFLTEDDVFLLREEAKFYVEGNYKFDDPSASAMTEDQIQQMMEWHSSKPSDRAIAFAICAYVRIISGVALEDESIYLFGLMNQNLIWLEMPDLESIEAIALARSISAQASKNGSAGAEKRHAPMRKLKDWTIDKYRSAKWKSIPLAASSLKAEVLAYGKTINAVLTEHNAQTTITKWLRDSA